LRDQRRQPQSAGVKQHPPGGSADQPKKAEEAEDATYQPQRYPADVFEEAGKCVVRRPRVAGGDNHPLRPNLIE
jgi:hypothetical protein